MSKNQRLKNCLLYLVWFCYSLILIILATIMHKGSLK